MHNKTVIEETEFQKKVKLLPPFENCARIVDKAGRRMSEEDANAYIYKRLTELEKKKQ